MAVSFNFVTERIAAGGDISSKADERGRDRAGG